MKSYFTLPAYRLLLTIWLLWFAFDASLLPVSIGFMTIYPHLLLTGFLFVYSFLAPASFLLKGLSRYALLFFCGWALYALIRMFFSENRSYAFYEVRGLILQSVYAVILLRSVFIMGTKNFLTNLRSASAILFVFLTIIGFAEFFTGIHLEGNRTALLLNEPAGMQTYAPVFVYDNPNTFLVYLFTAALLFILSGTRSTSAWPNLVIISVLFFFSIVAESKFGKIGCYLLLSEWLYHQWRHSQPALLRPAAGWMLLLLISAGVVAITRPLYWGPMWKDGERYVLPMISEAKVQGDSLVFQNVDSLIAAHGEDKVIAAYRKYQMKGSDWGINVRKNLLLNGWHFTKESGFFGIGPGQFRTYHELGKNPYPVGTTINPHFGWMEILSQYGWPVALPLLLLFGAALLQALRHRSTIPIHFSTLLIAFAVIFLISNMPSSWIILNAGWILLPVLLIVTDPFE